MFSLPNFGLKRVLLYPPHWDAFFTWRMWWLTSGGRRGCGHVKRGQSHSLTGTNEAGESDIGAFCSTDRLQDAHSMTSSYLDYIPVCQVPGPSNRLCTASLVPHTPIVDISVRHALCKLFYWSIDA